MKSVVYFYLMNDNRDEIKITATKHANYWTEKNLHNYKGGPFSDFSGGCITFSCDSYETANKLILEDPFIKSNCIKNYWLKEWIS